MTFSPAEAKLVSIFVQSILYGAHSVLFFFTTSAVWNVWPLRRAMLFLSILVYVVSTMHVATNFSRIIKAFVIFSDAPGGPAAFFNLLSEFTQMFGSTLFVLQTLIADCILIYRCYIVWNRKLYIIVLPLMLLMGSIATGIGILYAFDKVVPQADIFVVQLTHWITSFFSTTFATNVICTAIVGIRIWRINSNKTSFRARRLRPVLLLVVESGAVYSVVLMALLILYNVDSWFQYVVLDAVSPTVGIVFSIIMLRIASGISTEDGETALLGNDSIHMTTIPTHSSDHKMTGYDRDIV